MVEESPVRSPFAETENEANNRDIRSVDPIREQEEHAKEEHKVEETQGINETKEQSSPNTRLMSISILTSTQGLQNSQLFPGGELNGRQNGFFFTPSSLQTNPSPAPTA
eukprot:TRINITY_DN5005_c0_g1_i1.p1 TRINITY_DN5005_c0_g1~~TRINITY_DN5005_c0_g1_i1.p1  ORF type:complete len:109 (+),score=13.26 TRINITY_DN5005_c0_g1_i1:771-1097(+)